MKERHTNELPRPRATGFAPLASEETEGGDGDKNYAEAERGEPSDIEHELEAHEYTRESDRLKDLAVARHQYVVSVNQLLRRQYTERGFLIGPDLFRNMGGCSLPG